MLEVGISDIMSILNSLSIRCRDIDINSVYYVFFVYIDIFYYISLFLFRPGIFESIFLLNILNMRDQILWINIRISLFVSAISIFPITYPYAYLFSRYKILQISEWDCAAINHG